MLYFCNVYMSFTRCSRIYMIKGKFYSKKAEARQCRMLESQIDINIHDLVADVCCFKNQKVIDDKETSCCQPSVFVNRKIVLANDKRKKPTPTIALPVGTLNSEARNYVIFDPIVSS
jgi:hypothetical protein